MPRNLTYLLELVLEVSLETNHKVGFTFAPTAGEITFHFFDLRETHSVDAKSATAEWDIEAVTDRLLDLVSKEVCNG